MAAIEDLLQRRTDLSTFLVHLTRDSTAATALENLKSIITAWQIDARRPFGPGAHLEEHLEGSPASQKAVCMTETPLEHVWMMLEEIEGRAVQFKPYGIAITKTTGRKAGFNPVWYSDISTRGADWPSTSVNQLIDQAVERSTRDGAIDAALLRVEPVLRVTPYFEQMGPTREARKEFWWEREWRHRGNYYIGFPSRIVAVLAPEDEHAEVLAHMHAVDGEQQHWQGRPVLDPRWGVERMIAALAHVAPEDIGPFPGAAW